VNQEAEALCLDEIRTAAAAHPALHPQLVDSTRDGYLTAERALVDLPVGADPWVYMCGRPAMTSALADGFHQQRIPSNRIRWEQFDVRCTAHRDNSRSPESGTYGSV
jgi:predicted ferric reductase